MHVTEHSTSPLTPGEQRKRARIDLGAALIITMLLWPFPIARTTFTPAWNVLLVLLTWQIVNLVYHVVCARVWRRTAAMYLLGYSLVNKMGASGENDGGVAIRWGIVAGALVVVNAAWAPTSGIIEAASGSELRRH